MFPGRAWLQLITPNAADPLIDKTGELVGKSGMRGVKAVKSFDRGRGGVIGAPQFSQFGTACRITLTVRPVVADK